MADTDNTLQAQVNKDLLNKKKRKEIINTYKEEYGKMTVGRAINNSPIIQVGNLKWGSFFMAFVTVASVLFFLLDKYTTELLVVTIVICVAFSIPYTAAFIIFQFTQNLRLQKFTAYGIAAYHIVYIVANLILGAMMGTCGAGVVPILFVFYFIQAAMNWSKYEGLVGSKQQSKQS